MKGPIRLFYIFATLAGLAMLIVVVGPGFAAPNIVLTGEISPARLFSPLDQWMVMNSPNVGSGSNLLNSVTGYSATDLTAVGYYYDASSHQHTLIEHYDGSSWSVVTSQDPDPNVNALYSVTTNKAGGYWAAGSSFNAAHNALIEQQATAGGAWTLVSVPSLSGAPLLFSISADSATDAWAVGRQGFAPYHTLILHWNGTAWSIVTSPNPAAYDNELTGVVAADANNIWAIGRSTASAGGSFGPIAIRCNSSLTCTSVSFPSPGAGSTQLTGITALATNDIYVSGTRNNAGVDHPVVAHGDGTAFTIVTVPDPNPSGSSLGAIWGPLGTNNKVIAAGATISGTRQIPFALMKPGGSSIWQVSNPIAVGSQSSSFFGVGGYGGLGDGVTGEEDVYAVGELENNLIFDTLVQVELGFVPPPPSTATATKTDTPTRTPTRTPIRTPSPTPTYDYTIDYLLDDYNAEARLKVADSVAATSYDYVAMAGELDNAAAITECDSNDRCTAASLEISDNTPSQLNDITNLPDGSFLAVGSETVGGAQNGVVLKQTAPELPWEVILRTRGAQFEAVAYHSENEYWCVGHHVTPDGYVLPDVSHWDGTTWRDESFVTFYYRTYLVDVVDYGPNDVYVIGSKIVSPGSRFQPFVAHWDGTAWTEIPFPLDATLISIIDDVADPGHILIGGEIPVLMGNGVTANQPLIEYYDGTTFSRISTPAMEGEVRDFARTSQGNLLAVGVMTTTQGTAPLVLRGDTTGFVSLAPRSVGNISYFNAASQRPGGDVVMVGSYNDAGQPQPLAEVYHYGAPTPTPTLCPMTFTDVHTTDYFYTPVNYLYCFGVISGYPDNTFRPGNNTTRGQMSKIAALGYSLTVSVPAAPNYTFSDVPRTNTFFTTTETLAAYGIVGGYQCGGVGEPCDPQHRPYFRPYNNVTRGQLTKIAVNTASWPTANPPAPGTFEDVPPGSTFYSFIEAAVCHGIINGYPCGGVGEPCDPQHRPYFRPGNNATRGQISKIVYLGLLNPPTACTP